MHWSFSAISAFVAVLCAIATVAYFIEGYFILTAASLACSVVNGKIAVANYKRRIK